MHQDSAGATQAAGAPSDTSGAVCGACGENFSPTRRWAIDGDGIDEFLARLKSLLGTLSDSPDGDNQP